MLNKKHDAPLNAGLTVADGVEIVMALTAEAARHAAQGRPATARRIHELADRLRPDCGMPVWGPFENYDWAKVWAGYSNKL